MTTLEIIIRELQRQADESTAGGLGWLDTDDPRQANIDGRVDLVALAKVLDEAKVSD